MKTSHIGKGAGLTVPVAIAVWCAMPVGCALAANESAAAGVLRTDTNAAAPADSAVHTDESITPSQMSDAERREQAERSREVAAEVRAEAERDRERERAEERARSAAARGNAAAERAAERARAIADRDADAAHAKVEARLREAQSRLQQSAQEVAQLSAEVSRSVMQNFSVNWVQHAVIGVVIEHGSDPAGAHVREVSPGGAAADAGLRAGDLIVSINGDRMGGPDAAQKVVDAIQTAGANGKLRMHIKRDNKDQDIEVVARTPAGFGTAQSFAFTVPPVPAAPAAPAAPPAPPAPGVPFGQHIETSPFSFSLSYAYPGLGNMELATLTPQLGHYFGTDKGVLVVRAPKDSDFKLQDGDVILSIDGREPISGTHATRILASYQPGEKVVLHIMRERKALDVETKLPGSMEGRHRPVRGARQPEASS